MKVRAYDKNKAQYFKSEVYGIINKGWFEKYLVYAPAQSGNCFMLIDYLDKSARGPHYPVNINVIHSDYPETWVRYGNDDLADLHKSLKCQGVEVERLNYFIGCEVFGRKTTEICGYFAIKTACYGVLANGVDANRKTPFCL